MLLWIVAIISAVVHLALTGWGDPAHICEILLTHQFVVTFGLVGIIGAVVNIAKADKTAKKLGWPGGPFQVKYGFSQICLGIMGIMCIWFHGTFWLGAMVVMYMYGISGLWSHTALMLKAKKILPYEVGNIIMDLAYQAFITVLSVICGGVWVIGG
ncbi:MAG TPA: hypothetical protein DEQ02_10600 [Ruminococcaceae bacterium]|nr:hypothetical protein [Oscillospiraceae bacterium]